MAASQFHHVPLTMSLIILHCVVPPQMFEDDLNVQGVEGSEARIRCSASGLPKPKYYFYKVGRNYLCGWHASLLFQRLFSRIDLMIVVRVCKLFNR